MFIVIYLVVFKHFIISAPFLVKVCDIANVLRISNKCFLPFVDEMLLKTGSFLKLLEFTIIKLRKPNFVK